MKKAKVKQPQLRIPPVKKAKASFRQTLSTPRKKAVFACYLLIIFVSIWFSMTGL